MRESSRVGVSSKYRSRVFALIAAVMLSLPALALPAGASATPANCIKSQHQHTRSVSRSVGSSSSTSYLSADEGRAKKVLYGATGSRSSITHRRTVCQGSAPGSVQIVRPDKVSTPIR